MLRLVHARALRAAPRLPAAPQPAPDLRLVPLQQARPAHARRRSTYLKRYGPVGCRDWTTVYLLLSCGVPAFFSGCVTTTIDTVFPAARAAARGRAGRLRRHARRTPCRRARSRTRTRAARSGGARSSPTSAARSSCSRPTAAATARSSRHACTATCRSGRSACPPSSGRKNRSDIRFDGLLDIDDDAFGAIRAGLLDRLEQVHAAILTGRPEAEVYALWRELTAADVSAAEERRMRPLRLPPVAPEIGAADRSARSRGPSPAARAADAAVHCAVVLPQGGGRGAAGAGRARCSEHASRPLHLWVLARPGTGGGGAARARSSPRSASAACRSAGSARIVRLALPDLLPDVDRLVAAAARAPRRPATSPSSPRSTSARHAWAAPLRPGPRERLRRDPPRRGAARRPRPTPRPSCAARPTRATASTSTRSPATCWCWTSSGCAATASAARRCRSRRSSTCATSRCCTTSRARSRDGAGALRGGLQRSAGRLSAPPRAAPRRSPRPSCAR